MVSLVNFNLLFTVFGLDLLYCPSSKSLLRATTHLPLRCLSFFIDLLKLFISPAFKCHPPHTHPTLLWELPVDRAQGEGPSPPGNLGFLWNVLMRRQAASPRFLLWAFWGHSLAQPPHQEGSFFRESPQERERVR